MTRWTLIQWKEEEATVQADRGKMMEKKGVWNGPAGMGGMTIGEVTTNSTTLEKVENRMRKERAKEKGSKETAITAENMDTQQDTARRKEKVEKDMAAKGKEKGTMEEMERKEAKVMEAKARARGKDSKVHATNVENLDTPPGNAGAEE